MSEATSTGTQARPLAGARPRFHLIFSPFLYAPESVRTVFTVTFATCCLPLVAGLVLFGWRAAVVAAISIASCVLTEKLFFKVVRAPALVGRSHAWLTGLLLGLTLPADVPWYVPLVAAAFATTLGKAIFGGVGHFLWQPALVGRLAVTVIFPALLTGADGPILARNQLVRGDIRQVQAVQRLRDWPDQLPPAGYDGFVVEKPQQTLRLLYDSQRPRFSGIAYVGDGLERPEPPLLSRLPSVRRMMYGVRPGPMGGTCAVLILVAGVYLMYRNYVKPHLPLSFLLAAAVVAAIAPIHLVGHDGATRTVWYPFLYEGLAEGCVFLIYHLTSGGMLLAAFLLATEMTSRPVTRGGQVIFGLLGGALAMVLRICTRVPVPVFMAVLAVNTLTPLIDALWRPRVMGQSWLARFRLG